jgi:glycosyltransferase involved in cell wall biosynthesis
MRIVIVSDVPWPSGSAGSARVWAWASGLARLGCEVLVVPVGHFGPRDAPETDPEVCHVRVAVRARFSSRYGTIGVRGPAELRRIGAEVRDFRADWLLCYGRRLTTVGACVAASCQRARLALDLTEHPSITRWSRGKVSPAGWDHWLGSRCLLRAAHLVFAITDRLARCCMGWTSAPVLHVPAMQVGAGSPTTAQPGRFGYYGAWNDKDEPEFVCRVAAGLLRMVPDAEFEVIGSIPGTWRRALASMGAPLQRIREHGFVRAEFLPSVLGTWSLALLPRSDGPAVPFSFPNRAAELLWAGIPILVRERVGIDDLGFENGILAVDSYDAEKAARHAASMLADLDTNRALGRAARATARARLDGHALVASAVASMTERH